MSKALTLPELRKMNADDLRKEVESHRRKTAELRLHVRLGKEKGVHLYHSARKQLAQMLTILSELQRKNGEATIPAPRS